MDPINACRVCVVEVDTARYGPPSPPSEQGSATVAPPGTTLLRTVHQPVKIDDDLYVRDYSRCIMCYKCVNACGTTGTRRKRPRRRRCARSAASAVAPFAV